jgi:hypothetical protein
LYVALIIIFIGACAHGEKAIIAPGLSGIKTVYLWDADGHIDLTLLRGLKAQAAKVLKSKGLIVTDNPSATDAYVKITVEDANREDASGITFIKARLYVISAADNSTLYDKTAETKVTGGKDEAPAYPVEDEVRKLLSDYPNSGVK